MSDAITKAAEAIVNDKIGVAIFDDNVYARDVADVAAIIKRELEKAVPAMREVEYHSAEEKAYARSRNECRKLMGLE